MICDSSKATQLRACDGRYLFAYMKLFSLKRTYGPAENLYERLPPEETTTR